MTKQYSFHSLAEMFPLMDGAELDALAADIRAHGLIEPIIIHEDRILDGRNRYRACQQAGVDPAYRPFMGDDPLAFVVSANLHRRHLTIEQKREIAAKVLQGNPSLSDRQVGKMTGLSKNTAADVRHEAEGRGQIDHVDTRTDTKGRKQPATRTATATKTIDPAAADGDNDHVDQHGDHDHDHDDVDQHGDHVDASAVPVTTSAMPTRTPEPEPAGFFTSKTWEDLSPDRRNRLVDGWGPLIVAAMSTEAIRGALSKEVQDAIIDRAVGIERAHVAEENRVLQKFVEDVKAAVGTCEDDAAKCTHVEQLVRKFNHSGDDYPPRPHRFLQ